MITDYDGTVIEQPESKTEWVPCIQCGKRTSHTTTLVCDTCKTPKKGIRSLGLKNGEWVKDNGGVMRWVE